MPTILVHHKASFQYGFQISSGSDNAIVQSPKEIGVEKFWAQGISHHTGQSPVLSFSPYSQSVHEDFVYLPHRLPSQTLMDSYQRTMHQIGKATPATSSSSICSRDKLAFAITSGLIQPN